MQRNVNNQIRVKGIVENYLSDDIWNEERKQLLQNELDLITSSELSPYQSAESIISHYKEDILGNNQ